MLSLKRNWRHYLDTKFAKGLRREQSPDLRDDGAIQTANHYSVAFMQNTIGEDDVNGGTETLDNLYFQHRTLELRKVHESLAHTLLREVDQKHDHIGNTFSSNGGRRDQGNITSEVLVLVVQNGIETLLGEGDSRLLTTIFEFALHGTLLLRE